MTKLTPFFVLSAVVLAFCAAPAMAAGFQFSSNLHVGSTGSDVTALQAMLASDGYFTQPTTGYFGPITFAAVKAWQAANGVPSTGYFGPLSRAKANGTGSPNVSMIWPQNGVTLGTNVLLYAATVPNAGPVASLQFIVDGSSTSTPRHELSVFYPNNAS